MNQQRAYSNLSFGKRILLWLPVSPATVFGIVMIAVVLAAWLYIPARHPGRSAAGVECIELYRQAHSAADTAKVDARLPFGGGAKQRYAASCGVMRQRGDLQNNADTNRPDRVDRP